MSRAVFKPSHSGGLNAVDSDLKLVIDAFSKLQDDRCTADYDFERKWSCTDVKDVLERTELAFRAWRNIRKEKTAQDHLLTMFGARRE